MNERIWKLAEQAWETIDVSAKLGIPGKERVFNKEKFAELIVKECAEVAADHDALDIYEEIREHFGVKE